MPIKTGDTVCFTAAVIRNCGHDAEIANRRGHVVEIHDRLARVLWDGESLAKLVPAANLAKIDRSGAVLDPTF